MITRLIIASAITLMAQITLAQDFYQNPSFQKVWETPEGLITPESALYHKANNKVYVSNIAGKGWDKDSIGFISIITTDGQIENLKFCEGLSAPKGMGIVKNSLFVADIDRLVEIDLSSGKILKNYRNSKALALNDVDVDTDGTVYVTDSNNKRIFTVSGDSLSLFLESDALNRLNGIMVEGDHLLCGANDNQFLSINKTSKEIKVLMSGVGYIDGLIKIGENKYIVSNFKGVVTSVKVGVEIEKLLDSTPLAINAADLGYIPDKKIIMVPTFHNNKVIGYYLFK